MVKTKGPGTISSRYEKYPGVSRMGAKAEMGSVLSKPWRDHHPQWSMFLWIIVPPYMHYAGMISIWDPTVILGMIGLVATAFVLARFREFERGVILRFGKFHKVVGPGWFIILPVIDYVWLMDLRMEEIIIKPKEVVTKDKIRVKVSFTVFMYVTDPKRAALNVRDYKLAVLDYTMAALVRMVGSQNSDYIVAHMQGLSRDLEEGIAELASVKGKEWGVMVPRVEVKSIEFPDKVQTAMHNRIAAEQQKLAAYEQAEGTKVVIDAIREAGAKLTDPAITYLYLQTLDKIARGRATKYVIPLEISKIAEKVGGVAGSLSPDQSEQLQEVLSKYEGRIKELEGTMEKKEGKALEAAKAGGEEKEEEYKKKIEEIKKRIKGMEKR